MPSILSSPVGEFKGWFSNLFNWKVHTYVLYSTDALGATRTETVRILEQFGVIISPEDHGENVQNQGPAHVIASTLRCRLNDLVDSTNGTTIQKYVRFKVKFSTNASQAAGSTLPSPGIGSVSGTGVSAGVGSVPPPSSLVSSALSQTSAAAKNTLSKVAVTMAESGFSCAIVLVQEKGSVSTFRTLCRWLREEWALDALVSPAAGSPGEVIFAEQQQVMVIE